MRIGLLADIHEHVEELRIALDQLAAANVERIVVLGDVFADGQRIEETCRLLSDAGAVGVWGNHDFGLSFEPPAEMRQRFPAVVTDFMTSLQPRLEVDGCLCVHVEPWLDPHEIVDLWYFEGPPDTEEKVKRIFAAFQNPVAFGGHYHRWLYVTPDGVQDWCGRQTLQLDSTKSAFVVVNGLFAGSFAVYDTVTMVLEPRSILSPPG